MKDYLLSNLFNIILAFVGSSAFVIYLCQKHYQLRVAATLIKGEIDTIEKRILILKNDSQISNVSVYHSQKIIGENSWNKYKHLLVKCLSKTEIEKIERFFDNAEQVERARVDICNSMNNAWTHASLVERYIIGDLAANEQINAQELQNKIDDFRHRHTPLDIVFTPQIAINALMKYLNNFEMLSGTTGYKKIEKISYEK